MKKRLLEYLAVLRLKQSINDDVDADIKKVEEELGTAAEATPAAATPTENAKAGPPPLTRRPPRT